MGERRPGPPAASENSILPPGGVVETAVLEHGFRVRRTASPGFIHFAQILSISAREHHRAKTVAVGPGQPAMIDEPLVGVIGKHLGPQISVIAGGVTVVTPDVAEIARTITRRHITNLELG